MAIEYHVKGTGFACGTQKSTKTVVAHEEKAPEAPQEAPQAEPEVAPTDSPKPFWKRNSEPENGADE